MQWYSKNKEEREREPRERKKKRGGDTKTSTERHKDEHTQANVQAKGASHAAEALRCTEKERNLVVYLAYDKPMRVRKSLMYGPGMPARALKQSEVSSTMTAPATLDYTCAARMCEKCFWSQGNTYDLPPNVSF